MHSKSSIIITTLCLACSLCLSAQHVEWEYQVKDEVDTYTSSFWTDESGDGFYNIQKVNPDRPGDMSYGNYLLILDSEGQLKGKTYIKSCSAQATYLPYGKNKVLTSGNRCLTNGYENSSTVFNYKGKVLQKGEGFDGFYFSRVWSNGKYYCFSKPLDHYSFSFVSVGTIDKRLKLSDHHISLKQFEREGMGITNHAKDPVQLKNNSWVIPMALGEKTTTDQNRIEPSHGFVICTQDSTILWQYPKEITKQGLEQVDVHEKKIGVLFDTNKFVWLYEDGRVLQNMKLAHSNFYAKDMIINSDEVIIIGNRNITWFDHSGKQKAIFDFKSKGIHHPGHIREVEDGGIILTARKNNNVVVLKIFSNDAIEPAQEVESSGENEEKKAEEVVESDIGNTTIETISEDILSVSVFPNPATVYINFEIVEETNLEGPFTIEIFDQGKRIVHTNQFTDKFYSIDLLPFNAGTYIYRISVANDQNPAFVSGQFVKL